MEGHQSYKSWHCTVESDFTLIAVMVYMTIVLTVGTDLSDMTDYYSEYADSTK